MSKKKTLIAAKFGSDTVGDKSRIYDHARRLAVVHKKHNLIVTTSGAVARGGQRLEAMNQQADQKDKRLRAFLGTASVGTYREEGFERQGILAGQMLMTYYEMVDAREGQRYRDAMAMIFKNRMVPISNYKDILSVASDPHDEAKKIDEFTDNDVKAREEAEILGAEAIIFAIHGKYGFEDETGEVVRRFEADRLEDMDQSAFSVDKGRTGGIFSKLTQSVVAVRAGMRAFICNDMADFDQVLGGQQKCTEVIQ